MRFEGWENTKADSTADEALVGRIIVKVGIILLFLSHKGGRSEPDSGSKARVKADADRCRSDRSGALGSGAYKYPSGLTGILFMT